MDRIRELLQSLTQLSAEDLEELRGLILTEFDRVDGEATTPENVALLQELADAGEQVQAESGNREAAQAQAEADAQAARDRIAAITNSGEEDETDETPETPEAETPETPEAEEAAEAETPESEPAPVAASAVQRVAARSGRPTPSPEAPERGRTSLVAAGGMRDITPGTEISDRWQLAEGMAGVLQRMPRHGAARGEVILASASWEDQYPEERRLRPSDPNYNTRVLDAVVGPQALAASGGICAPVNVDYSIGMLATADRPVRDSFPSFSATRGGLTFRPDLDIAGLLSATTVWTEATDANPGNATKPVVSVACPSPSTVYVDAVPTRIGFGNMQSRFDPETVAANTDAAIAAAARVAEINLLQKVAAACTADVTNTSVNLGAARDLLTTVDQVVAAYRSLHRLSPNQMFTAIFPDWLKNLLRIDFARELGHDNSSDWNVWQITDEQLNGLLRARGVNAVWHLDGQSAGQLSGAGGVGQVFGVQGASGAVQSFPTKMVWYIFIEGQFQFLDGGRLDLGVVRDATLDATNDYETFVETFEGLIYRGFTGGAYQMVSTLCANGASGGTVATSSCA